MGPNFRREQQVKNRCEGSDPGDPDAAYLEALTMLYGTPNPADTKPEEQIEIRSPDHLYDPMTRRVSVRAWPENQACSLDQETGEILCEHAKRVPNLDCREPWCLHRAEMLARTRRRLTLLGYAPGTNNGAERFLLRQATEDVTK